MIISKNNNPRLIELRRTKDWHGLNQYLFELAELEFSKTIRLSYFYEMAEVYEYELNDLESAFVVYQAAMRDNYTNDMIIKEVDRLADLLGLYSSLITEYADISRHLEKSDSKAAEVLRFHLDRWNKLEEK